MTHYIDPARKVRYHVGHLDALKRGEIPTPINVEIDLTNRCSLGCEWCHFAYTHTRGPLAGKRDKPAGHIDGGDVMDRDLAHKILAQLFAAGVQSVTWTGGGEPTLHPYFDDIIAGCPLPQGLYTHGGHIDEARAALLKKRCEWVYVSLDEISKDAYQRSKGVDGGMAAVDGICNLVNAKGDATIGVGFLLHIDNWKDAPEMQALALGLGVDYVQFRPTVRYDMAAPGKRTRGDHWLRRAAFLLDNMSGVLPGTVDRFIDYDLWTGHGYDTCYWSALQTVITPSGKVWDCVNKREFPGAELGDLSRETWSDVWARRQLVKVDDQCRVLCRGHIANVAVNEILVRPAHAEFV